MKINPVIVVIAYNRDDSLKRLLDSLKKADYSQAGEVNLIISIDKSENSKVASVAESFTWENGVKKVITHDKRLGLKNHVLECSSYCQEYGSVIVLEDDLFVAQDFYNYSCQALEVSSDDERVAGVSLYTHLLNVHAREPFEAIDDGFDNWYFQFASSWGQAYTYKQWNGFIEWMKENGAQEINGDNVPLNVSSWGDSSWLKYYIKYMIDTDKYFIYPRTSLCTNFSEEGTHKMGQIADLQVPMLYGNKNKWNISRLDESNSIYDAYFENTKLTDIVARDNGIDKDDILIDLYGRKQSNQGKKYILSCNSYSNRIITSYGRFLRPIDRNIIERIGGKELFLYDLDSDGIAPKIDVVNKLLYNYRAFKAKYGLEIIKTRLRNKLK